MAQEETMTLSVLVLDASLTARKTLAEALEAEGIAATDCADSVPTVLEGNSFAVIVLGAELGDGPMADRIEALAPHLAGSARIWLCDMASLGDTKAFDVSHDAFVGADYDVAQVAALAKQLALSSACQVRRQRVLVIDDSATFREELSEALREASYEVETAASGEQGIELAAQWRPDAIVVDRIMPGIDGATVVRRVRVHPVLRRVPCLLLTAEGAEEAELEALEAGADAFVRKDEELALVLARLGATLRGATSPYELPEPTPQRRPHVILAVDDSTTYLHALGDELADAGYEVALAASGREAMERLGGQKIDCILLDLVMPGMNGDEVCQRIKASPEWRDIPIVILTGTDEPHAMIHSINAGADDYIVKSADPEVLKARLKAQIRRKQFDDEARQWRLSSLKREMEAAEARAASELAETRAGLLADLERNNRELVKAKERAERESQFKSRFLANASHELRTPLTAILGFSQLLDKQTFGALNPRQADYVRNIVVSSQHLLALVNDILDLSRIEAGRMALQFEWTNFGELARAARTVLTPLADKRQVELYYDLPPDELTHMYADPLRVKQILYNLISNGLKFTQAGGTVTLSATVMAGRLEFCVADTGVGIKVEDMKRLFQVFERIESGDTRQEGSGLGLALTKKLLELHQGSIRVTSTPGRGSMFTVTLPISQDASMTPPPPSPPPPSPPPPAQPP
jgi:signal transduction histidine kinase